MATYAKYIPPGMEDFKKALRQHNLKATQQRLAVHSVMIQLGHASADMVEEKLKEYGTVKITVASVYNILTQLARLGIYSYRLSRNNKMYFDVNAVNHIHLYDADNHEYKDVLDEELLTFVEQKLRSSKFRGYKIDNIDIQINCHTSSRRQRK